MMSDDRKQITLATLPALLLLGLFGWAVELGLERLFAPWRAPYLPFLSLAIAVLGAYARRAAAALEGRQRLAFFASMGIAVATALKLFLYALGGFDQLWLDLPRWQADPLTFFSPAYSAALALALIAFSSAYAFTGELDALFDRGEQQGWDDLGKLQNALQHIRARMAGRVLILGAVATAFAVVARVNLTVFGNGFPAAVTNALPVVVTLLYFAVALTLLALAQFALLRTRWRWQHTPVLSAAGVNGESALASAWLRWGLVFFGVLALVSLLLPTRYSIGFFDTLRLALDLLVRLIAGLMVLLLLPLGWLLSLFGFAQSNGGTPSFGDPPGPAEVVPPPAPPADWWVLLQAVAFWVVFIAVIGLGLFTFARQNVAIWGWLTRLGLTAKLNAVWGWLRSLWRDTQKATSRIASEVRVRFQQWNEARSQSRMQPRLRGGNTPRERVIRDYLALLRLTAAGGAPRRVHQTPAAYADRLRQSLPDTQTEITALSQAFEEARYSSHPITPPQAEAADSWLDRLRAALSLRH